ncbi:unnamed protein product [Penicillium salamii]|uniref:Ubiquitin carboxyl-terminal hydrolase n=1 Tax=Penicillium salamii TaxID=1612424 RepID=A0A9W4JQR5_9EURO|nr:unnamed protein product [Penicillium salamii]CAG8396343.1 unnamed protein product [Penicillium salamii]CAG8415506.1 unnamed protein product [Penicillium salamii]CAG8420773.1 unnamed protein product [Penicillium salamii]
MDYEKHFIPLESDPQIFTSLMHNLGVPQSYKFIDIWSLEADELDNLRSSIQNRIEALILILPDCPAYAEQRIEQIPKEGMIWLKQTINNACGLYAILHCICNILDTEEIGSFVDHLLKEILISADPANYMQNSPELDSIYRNAALSGSSEPPAAEDEVDHHYICLVKCEGCLFELDGDRTGPMYRGSVKDDEDALSELGCNVLKMYMNSCPEGGFSLLALVNYSTGDKESTGNDRQ